MPNSRTFTVVIKPIEIEGATITVSTIDKTNSISARYPGSATGEFSTEVAIDIIATGASFKLND